MVDITSNTPHRGWVGQCDQRGSIDIIWSCLLTIGISLWVMLHLNVPAQHEGFWTCFFRRTKWLILGVLAPETLLLAAGGQWASAKRSVVDMRSLNSGSWTLAHAFYADSGGFLLQPLDVSPFPVTAKQIHYLVKHSYLNVPDISEKEIFDKSKADYVTKTIACLQTGWFVTECIARAIQKLPVSPLELNTCAIILCTVTVYFFWLEKPLDVSTPTTLTVRESIQTILQRAGSDAEQSFWNTPLDFVEPPTNYTFGNWPDLANRWGPYRKPLVRIPNDRNPRLYGLRQRSLYTVIVIIFSTLSFVEWYFVFPTNVEKTVWRVACIVCNASLLVHALVEGVVLLQKSPPYDYIYIEGYKLQWPANLLFFVPAATYFVARIALIAIAVSSLRMMPAKSFVQIKWSSFIPHF
ncbi:MAG: hypothetical protein Q9209_006713 [Squamulea sp. 1 TL-2023]